MRSKILIGSAVVLAFVGGLLLSRYKSPDSSTAYSSPDMNRAYTSQGETNTGTDLISGTRLDLMKPVSFTCEDGRLIVSTGQDGQTRVDCVRDTTGVTQVSQRYVSRSALERERPRAHRKRSFGREALIVAGSAGAGTAIGALAGGKKGAAIGALTGGVGGLAYDLATRNK